MSINTDLGSSIGKVRLEIGDTDDTRGKGVKPDGTAFTDPEIEYFLSVEGDSVGRAAAHACEALARAWARVANSIRGNRSDHFSDVSEQYRKQAEALRRQYGGGSVVGVAISAPVIRVDGYSEHATEAEL